MVRHLNIPLDDNAFLELKTLKSFLDYKGGKEASWPDFMMVLLEYYRAVGNGTIEQAINDAKWIKPEVKDATRKKVEKMLNGLKWIE